MVGETSLVMISLAASEITGARARVAPTTQIFARDGDIPLKRTRGP